MSDRSRELAARRTALQARCALQRGELGEQGDALEIRLAQVDRVIAIVRRVASAPVLIGVAVVALFFVGPRRIMRWASRGVFLVSAARRLARH